MNQHAKYLGQRSFNSKVIVRTHTHTDTSPRLSAWPVVNDCWVSDTVMYTIALHVHLPTTSPCALQSFQLSNCFLLLNSIPSQTSFDQEKVFPDKLSTILHHTCVILFYDVAAGWPDVYWRNSIYWPAS